MNRQFGIGTLIGAVIVGGAWLIFALARSNPSASNIASPEGNLVVKYTIITRSTETTESTVGGEIPDVTAIAFYPAYIVVQTKAGHAQVFFHERTKALSWRRAEAK